MAAWVTALCCDTRPSRMVSRSASIHPLPLRHLAVVVIHDDQGIVNHLIQWCWYPYTLSMADYRAVDGVDFDTPLALEIHRHGGVPRVTGRIQVVHRALHDVGRHVR